MCGITGFLRFDRKKVPFEVIETFNNSLAHRGPDASGVFLNDECYLALGHRRLSIVDIDEAANQPFISNCGRYVITFNGEIYNYLELKEELMELGYNFRTSSDTEVILAAYDHWQESCLHKLNGMWAFSIWDNELECLFASRDRFGVKPFYYHSNDRYFAFASEQKAFKSLDEFTFEIEPSHAAFAVCNSSSFEAYEECLYKGLRKLRPGEFIKLGINGECEITKWWVLEEHLLPAEANVAEAIDVFKNACEVRTRTDVDIAFSLSGGMDSSSVTTYTLPFLNDERKRYRAFIGSFPGSDLDEFERAKTVAEAGNLDYSRVAITQNASTSEIIDCMRQAEDVMRAPPIGQWLIYKRMKQEGFKVSVEGHGGDELLGGYFNHVQAYLGDCIHLGHDLDEVAHTILLIDNMRSVVGYGPLSLPMLIRRSTGLTYSINKTGFLSQFMQTNKAGFTVPNYLNPQRENGSLLQTSLLNDFSIFTLPNILRNYDKAAMGHSVEVRSPFLDWRFVLQAIAMPSSLKIKNGKTKTFLRDYLVDVPEEIRSSDIKLGFNFPLTEWLQHTYESFLAEFLNDSMFLQNNLFDGKRVATAINKKIAKGKWDQLQSFWPLIHLTVLNGGVK